MDQNIVGRKEEVAILREIYESNEPQFLAVYGRRRIGKTFLIHEFFRDKGVYFEITGVKGGKTSEQLLHFSYEFSLKFNNGDNIPTPRNWSKAFHLLNDAVEKVPKEKKIILFFDEVPWLASQKSRFLNALEHFWNRYMSRKNNLIMIICGSAASWIIKKIIYNKGGLHGRVTRKIRLLPFTLLETEEYLKSRHIEFDKKQIVELYMVFGGVPKYLSYAKRGTSVTQIINDTCFSVMGGLYDEFDKLYQSLFDSYEHHVAIVKTLAKTISGLTKNELIKNARLTSGGTSSKIIKELIDSGFIIYIPPFGKKKVGGKYRLIDEYSLFHETWIESISNISLEGVDSQFWIKKYHTPKWNAWSGYAFESLCLKHIYQIKKALGVSGISTVESGWWYIPKTEEEKGAQIDLVIDREDRCINLCEIKFSELEFVIDKPYAEKLQNKKLIFRSKMATNKTLFTTMITTYGVKKNDLYLATVENQLIMDSLFQ